MHGIIIRFDIIFIRVNLSGDFLMMANEHAYKDLSLIIAEKQKVIDRLTHEKNSLMKIISHDVRTPFSQLFALIQMMELDIKKMTRRQRQYIDRMYHAVISGIEMIKNLNDVRAIEQGRNSVRIEKFDLYQLLDQIIQGSNIQARLRKIHLIYKADIKRVDICSDKNYLRKIIENILSNAIRYSDLKSEVTIELESHQSKNSIRISDKGPGIPEKDIPRIFEKYSKIENKSAIGESTTGLGMYLAKYFSDLLAGELIVENSRPHGLIVTLILPKSLRDQEQ